MTPDDPVSHVPARLTSPREGFVLSYGTPISRRDRTARRIRIAMVVAAILALHVAALCLFNPVLGISEALGGGTAGTPFAPVDPRLSDDVMQQRYAVMAAGYLAIFLILQWWFLCPRGSWKISPSLTGPPPKRAAIAAGFIGMLLCIGLLATLMELPDWWLRFTAEGAIKTPQHFAALWPVMLGVWTFWAIVFHVYCRSLDRYTALSRVFRGLVSGTILELVVSVPAHAVVLRSRGGECYCERGTWTGIAFGGTAALWLFGPGALLLFMRERRRREILIMPLAPDVKE